MMRGFTFLLALLLCVLCAPAQAQSTLTLVPAPAVISAVDPMAQRMQACTACHGQQGRAGPDGYYPRLAGKPAGYLYNQLLNFRDGRRHYGLMTRMVDLLPDNYLHEIAQHFARQHAPYPPPTPIDPPPAPALLARGEQLVRHGDASRQLPACAQCHGPALMGALPATPGLVGLPRDYLIGQLGGWQTGQRRAHAPDCMATIAKRLSAADLQAVSTWLATQPVPAGAEPTTQGPAPGALPDDLRCGSAVAPGASR